MKTRENWIKEHRKVRDGESSPYYSNEGDFLYALDQTEETPKLRTEKAWRKKGRKTDLCSRYEINSKGKEVYPKSSTKKIKGNKNDKN